MTTKNNTTAAREEISAVLKILGNAAAGGPRSKPTIAQLNEMVERLETAEHLLRLTLIPGD